MTIKSIEVAQIAQICFAAVSTLRFELKQAQGKLVVCGCPVCMGEEVEKGKKLPPCTAEKPQTWEGLTEDERGSTIDYITRVLTGRPCPDTPDGRMIARVCHQFADPKKTLKYA